MKFSNNLLKMFYILMYNTEKRNICLIVTEVKSRIYRSTEYNLYEMIAQSLIPSKFSNSNLKTHFQNPKTGLVIVQKLVFSDISKGSTTMTISHSGVFIH